MAPEDKLAEAIADVESKPIKMAGPFQMQIMGNPNRPAILSLPVDVTDIELLAIIGAVLQIGDTLRAQRPSSRIIIPS